MIRWVSHDVNPWWLPSFLQGLAAAEVQEKSHSESQAPCNPLFRKIRKVVAHHQLHHGENEEGLFAKAAKAEKVKTVERTSWNSSYPNTSKPNRNRRTINLFSAH